MDTSAKGLRVLATGPVRLRRTGQPHHGQALAVDGDVRYLV